MGCGSSRAAAVHETAADEARPAPTEDKAASDTMEELPDCLVLDITGVVANGLDKGGDSAGLSDPYVLFAAAGVEGRTATVRNTGSPAWASAGSPTLSLPGNTELPLTVSVVVMDEDRKSADDCLGRGEFVVEATGEGRADGVAIAPQGTLAVVWTASL